MSRLIVVDREKAAQKRERNAEKQKGPSKSQAKVNEAAKTIICSTCKQDFLLTTRAPALEEHAANKHSKTMADCFPAYKEPKIKSSSKV